MEKETKSIIYTSFVILVIIGLVIAHIYLLVYLIKFSF